jgi:endonuclease G
LVAIISCSPIGYDDAFGGDNSNGNTEKPSPNPTPEPEPTPKPNPLLNKGGWLELPAITESDELVFGAHDKLPSNNKLRNYSFCFDKEKHCSIWVAYPLHECYMGNVSRDDDWKYDPYWVEDAYEPDVSGTYKANASTASTHDRGHHLPSDDRTKSVADNQTTFYGTNVTPQLAGLNRGKWKTLEGDVRKWANSDTLYVVTGAHFAEGTTYATIRDNGGQGKSCPIPTHYYKVVLRTKSKNSGKWVANCSADELQCAGFWFDNTSGAQRQTMSVAEIERKTGLTFFSNVPNAPKSTYNPSDWQ